MEIITIPAPNTIQADVGQNPAFRMVLEALITYETGLSSTKIFMKGGSVFTGTKAFERNTRSNMVISEILSTMVELLANKP